MQGGQRNSTTTRAHTVLARIAAAILVVAIVADAAGLLTNRVVLWAAGARLITVAVALAALALVAGVIARRLGAWRITGCALAIFLLAVARYVRGHPEVRPDPPIFLAEIVAGLALLGLLRLASRYPVGQGFAFARAEPPRRGEPLGQRSDAKESSSSP